LFGRHEGAHFGSDIQIPEGCSKNLKSRLAAWAGSLRLEPRLLRKSLRSAPNAIYETGESEPQDIHVQSAEDSRVLRKHFLRCTLLVLICVLDFGLRLVILSVGDWFVCLSACAV
jgi:hypothetical protein